MFHPVTSLVSSVECVFANSCTFSSASRSQLSIEVSSNNRYAIFVVCRLLLDCSVHFSTWWSAYPEWVKKTLISFDALVVYHDRGSDGPLVDAFGIDSFCRYFLFSIIPTPCLLSYFPAPMNVFLVCLPNF